MASTDEDRGGSPLLPHAAPREFHLLAKPTGAVCNLDCTYCFFLSKEMLYPGSRFRMADDLLETYLRELIEAHAASPEVVVAWQGGEPTMMGLEFFARSVELAEGLKQPGQRIVHTIQTNGTLLTDVWGRSRSGCSRHPCSPPPPSAPRSAPAPANYCTAKPPASSKSKPGRPSQSVAKA